PPTGRLLTRPKWKDVSRETSSFGRQLSLPGSLSEQQMAALGHFERLLATRAVALGSIAAGDRTRIRERHVEDALRALSCVGSTDLVLVDLGSGAGLP